MKFRLPELEDRSEIMLYIEEHYSNNEKSLSATSSLTLMEDGEWVKKIHDNTFIPDPVWGKSFTYLAFNEEDELVGFLSIRFDIPEDLVLKYGHIGYGVRPNQRRKGYASQMLQCALDKCRELGMESVILGCYRENIGSSKTITKNGDRLTREMKVSKKISDYWEIQLVDQFYEIELNNKDLEDRK